jgi:AcrR family transcriptional regulator
MAKSTRHTKTSPPSADAIVDAAIALAGRDGWARVRMMHLSTHFGVPLAQIHDRFRDMDDIADAWFTRASKTLAVPTKRGFAKKPAKDRLFEVIMRWLNALAAERQVSAQIIRQKLYPSHPHHWMPMVFSLSRLVHLILDAAMIDSHGRQRQADELGGSMLVLATLWVWAGDDTPGQERTQAFLARRLEHGDRLMARMFATPSD